MFASDRPEARNRKPSMPESNSFLVQNVREALDLVLLVVEQGLEGHDVGADHVAGREAARVEDGALREDDAASVRITLRQHEHVAHVDELAQVRVLNSSKSY